MRKSPGLGFIGLMGLLLLLVLSACQQQGGQTGGQPSFNITLNPTRLNVTQGGSETTTLTLTPQNSFSGTVSLSVVNPPSGITVNFNPSSLTLPSQT